MYSLPCRKDAPKCPEYFPFWLSIAPLSGEIPFRVAAYGFPRHRV